MLSVIRVAVVVLGDVACIVCVCFFVKGNCLFDVCFVSCVCCLCLVLSLFVWRKGVLSVCYVFVCGFVCVPGLLVLLLVVLMCVVMLLVVVYLCVCFFSRCCPFRFVLCFVVLRLLVLCLFCLW